MTDIQGTEINTNRGGRKQGRWSLQNLKEIRNGDIKIRSINLEEINLQPVTLQTGLAGQFALREVDDSGNAFIDMIASGPIGEFTLVGSVIPAVDAGGAGVGSVLGSAARAYGLVRSYLFSTASDERLKKDIADVQVGLKELNKLRPVAYKYKKGDDQIRFGFIAQEVLDVLPNIVDGTEQTNYGVSYQDIIAVLVKSVQELSDRVDELEK